MPNNKVRLLALETSSPRLSVALGDDRALVAQEEGEHEWRHADTLFEALQRMLKKARWPLRSLTGVAVSVGPGSFTGIRIGLAAARALGQSLRVPVVGVSALETLAAGAPPSYRWVVPQIDALRGMVFTALYEREDSGSLRCRMPAVMADPDRWRQTIRARTRRAPVWISPLQGCYPEASTLLALARPRLADSGPTSYTRVLPFYIREAAAMERRKGTSRPVSRKRQS